MRDQSPKGCTGSCCSGDARTNLLGADWADRSARDGLSRADFLKVVGLGALGLSTAAGSQAFASAEGDPGVEIIAAGPDRLIIDRANRELRISCDVTKDASKPSVVDWGRRFQAWFGSYGGKMEKWFVLTTRVGRDAIDRAIRELGIRSRRQIPMEDVAKHTGLRPDTQVADYLDGDPVIVTLRFEKEGQIVEGALEDFIDEKIEVGGREVLKPYTPHWVYHGTGEAIAFPSGCMVCPSDCNGGIITDNVLPLKTTVNYYRVNWDKMPPPGSRAEVAIKSIYGPAPLSSVKA